jgi:hypothetical protein
MHFTCCAHPISRHYIALKYVQLQKYLLYDLSNSDQKLLLLVILFNNSLTNASFMKRRVEINEL